MSIQTDIITALLARVAALVLSPVLPVKYPDIGTFGQPAVDAATRAGRYLQVIHLPNIPTNYGWDITGPTLYDGLLRVSVVDPLHLGSIEPTVICDLIAAWFDKGTVLTSGSTSVQIQQKPGIGSAIEDGQNTIYPVTIRYHCSG